LIGLMVLLVLTGSDAWLFWLVLLFLFGGFTPRRST